MLPNMCATVHSALQNSSHVRYVGVAQNNKVLVTR